MPIYKKQRFHHSEDVRRHMKERGVEGKDCRSKDGRNVTTYYDLNNNEHLGVKEGEQGHAANMFIVTVLSCAGFLAILAFFFFGG